MAPWISRSRLERERRMRDAMSRILQARIGVLEGQLCDARKRERIRDLTPQTSEPVEGSGSA